jgi:hypothetical protein
VGTDGLPATLFLKQQEITGNKSTDIRSVSADFRPRLTFQIEIAKNMPDLLPEYRRDPPGP